MARVEECRSMILYALAAAILASAQPDPSAAAQPAPDDPIATLAGLNDLYSQTCQVKAYAAYDDICHALRDQIHDAEKAADKAAKARAKAKSAEKIADKSKPDEASP
jgi:hypothetical protein